MEDWIQHVVNRKAQDQSLSIRALAREVDVSRERVMKALAEQGLAKGRSAPQVTGAQYAAALHSDTPTARLVKATGLGIVDVARLIECDPQTLRAYVRGQRNTPRPTMALLHLLTALGAGAVRQAKVRGAKLQADIEAQHVDRLQQRH